MNNKDRALAQRTIKARMVRMDKKRPGSSAMIFSPTRLKSLDKATIKAAQDARSAQLAYIKRPDSSGASLMSPIKPGAADELDRSMAEMLIEPVEDPLVKELSQQTLTQKANLRKMAMKAKRNMATAIKQKGTFKFDDAHFIPKRPIRRPDGASLSQVYESKKQDLWGAIIKQQYIESEKNKVVEKQQKEKANEQFGMLLTKQLKDNAVRLANLDNGDEKMMKEVEALSKKNHDEQLRRTQAAKDRHKQFIANALEDIETKRVQREKDLEEEMLGSAMLIEKTKYLIAQDQEKAEKMKENAKKEQARLFEENIAAIQKRQNDKLADWDEVARITRQAEENFQRQEAAKKRELAHLEKRAGDGPAHRLTQQVMEGHAKEKEKMYSTFLGITDSLSRQLKKSEDADNYRRAQLRGSGEISSSWDDMVNRLAKEREDERNRSIGFGRHAARLDKEHWENEKVKKSKRQEAAAEYQSALDEQLSILRNKSLSSLKETMNQREKDMNMSLIRRYGIPE